MSLPTGSSLLAPAQTKKLPGAEEAGKVFQSLDAAIGDHPVDVSKVGDVALDAADWASHGGQRIKQISDFLQAWLYNAVKAAILTLILTFTFAACKRSAEALKPVSMESKDHKYCAGVAYKGDACGSYRVLSFEMTKMFNGNIGQEFVLERDGIRIVADCVNTCSQWEKSVGKVVEGDKSMDDFISYHDPLCGDPELVQRRIADLKKVRAYYRQSNPNPTMAEVCDEPLAVRKMEATSHSR